ncbi:acyl-CoA synthetase [Alkalihalophilus pseudofirmus]|nr:acyl-CoA synthetase [Alkalihalophilus pseudofirmus]
MDINTLNKEMSLAEEVVVRKLEYWAKTIGDRTFFNYGEDNKRYTFKEFNELTNSIAHHLQSMNVKKGDRVSLFLKNPLVTSLMMFGIWKVGAVFSPINYNYMGKLLSYQINDTNPSVLITERQLVSKINEVKNDITKLNIVLYSPLKEDHDYLPEMENDSLDKEFNELSFDEMLRGNLSNLDIELDPWDTANIIYTSGTTGPAKGVVQSHRWNFVCTFYLGKILNHEDVIYNDLPLYHIGGAIQGITRAAYVGCEVAVWDKFSPKDFWDRIHQSGATTAILVDVMMPWLTKATETPMDRHNTLNKVYVQPLPQYHHELARRFSFDFIMAGYGQTEAGHGCVTFIQELDDKSGTPPELFKGRSRKEIVQIANKYGVPVFDGREEIKKGLMGKPSIFKEISILNEHDEECETGEIGQISYRPRIPFAILTEYFGKIEATLNTTKNFWFHTGDAGFKDEDGFYYFVDRMGTVIRVKGENISSYQVEDIIYGHQSVELCSAFPIPAEEGDEDDIVVYIVLKKGDELDELELHQWINKNMPKYMRPTYIRFIDEIPKTPTNKVEKYKLKNDILRELSENQMVERGAKK